MNSMDEKELRLKEREDSMNAMEYMECCNNSDDVPYAIAKSLYDGCVKYRAMCESMEKRIARYRDVASAPDIKTIERNKDAYRNIQDAKNGYYQYCEIKKIRPSEVPFDEWLFDERSCGKEDL